VLPPAPAADVPPAPPPARPPPAPAASPPAPPKKLVPEVLEPPQPTRRAADRDTKDRIFVMFKKLAHGRWEQSAAAKCIRLQPMAFNARRGSRTRRIRWGCRARTSHDSLRHPNRGDGPSFSPRRTRPTRAEPLPPAPSVPTGQRTCLAVDPVASGAAKLSRKPPGLLESRCVGHLHRPPSSSTIDGVFRRDANIVALRSGTAAPRRSR
jgi:hypothetical protein